VHQKFNFSGAISSSSSQQPGSKNSKCWAAFMCAPAEMQPLMGSLMEKEMDILETWLTGTGDEKA